MIVSLINNPRGLNFTQLRSLQSVLKEIDVTEFNHGGDRQDNTVHDCAIKSGYKINIYPLVSNKTSNPYTGTYHEPTNISTRNRKLVDIADIVIAAPMVVFEYEDSAAWRTINYALSRDKEITILSPRGNIYDVSRARLLPTTEKK